MCRHDRSTLAPPSDCRRFAECGEAVVPPCLGRETLAAAKGKYTMLKVGLPLVRRCWLLWMPTYVLVLL